MSAANKAVARRVLEAMSEGNVDDAARLLAPDYVWHGPGAEVHGPDGWKQLASIYLQAFPDLSFTLEDQIAEGDKVVTRYTARGTHRGELSGVAASGRPVAVPCLVIDTIVDGQIVDSFEVFDQLGMFAAIGTFPALPESV
jgi:predicted ester cyclase